MQNVCGRKNYKIQVCESHHENCVNAELQIANEQNVIEIVKLKNMC